MIRASGDPEALCCKKDENSRMEGASKAVQIPEGFFVFRG